MQETCQGDSTASEISRAFQRNARTERRNKCTLNKKNGMWCSHQSLAELNLQ